jgi:ABC-type transport system involved in multi-copper enzyme maturation permease subunit
MKITALLLMLITIIALFGFGFMFLLGFAMSFDAPGSQSDPKAWGMRFLFFLPVLLLICALIFSFIAFSSGNYRRVILINIVPIAICVAIFAWMTFTSTTSFAKYKVQMAKEAEDAQLYPEQRFLRSVEGGTDTIIVFPNRLVAYRKFQGTNIPWAGPLGDLNDDRTTLKVIVNSDTKIMKDELDQFVDEKGRKFSEVYIVQ